MSADPSTQPALALRRLPSLPLGVTLGAVGSLLLHAGVLAVVLSYGTAPSLGFELTLPTEIEFGMSGGMELPGGATATPPVAATPPPEPPSGEDAPGAGAGDAGVPVDGGDADAGRRRRRDAGSDANTVAMNTTTPRPMTTPSGKLRPRNSLLQCAIAPITTRTAPYPM